MQTHELKTLAHDFRSPLTALRLTTAELCLEADHSQFIEQCLKSIESMVSKLSELGASRPLALAPTPSVPAQILKDLGPRLEKMAAKHQMDVSLWIAPHTLTLLSPIEALDFERAIINLATNAFEASPKGGLVSIAVRTQGDTLLVRIQDQGHGIPSHLLKEVLLPGKTFGKSHGQGLGLSQAKLAAEKSGGSLVIQSVEGQGTQIIMGLPIIQSIKSQSVKPTLSLCA